MAWKRISFEVARDRAAPAEAALEALGALSVTLADAGDDPILEPAPGENPLWGGVRVTALFEPDADGRRLRAAVARSLHGEAPRAWFEDTLADQTWERAWLADFAPMRFGERLWIVPTGCEAPEPGAVNLHFDPGLAFGTGSHPTTELCLQWLAAHPPVGQRVIDYGCGSGVLAVAALRLGATAVVGIDNDPQALVASRENADRNSVGAALDLLDARAPTPEPAPAVIANILSGVLDELADRIQACVAGGGQLILSGVLAHQADDVAAAFAPRFRFERVVGRDGWVRLDGRSV